MIDDLEIMSLDFEERWVWIIILSIASKTKKNTIYFPVEIIGPKYCVNIRKIKSTIEKLKQFKVVTVNPNGSRTQNEHVPNEIRDQHAHQRREEEKRREEKKRVRNSACADSKPFTDKLYKKWIETYEKDFVDHEIKKADAWMEANPKRRPKSSFARFYTNWLSRGWERHRKNIPSEKVKPKWETVHRSKDGQIIQPNERKGTLL